MHARAMMTLHAPRRFVLCLLSTVAMACGGDDVSTPPAGDVAADAIDDAITPGPDTPVGEDGGPDGTVEDVVLADATNEDTAIEDVHDDAETRQDAALPDIDEPLDLAAGDIDEPLDTAIADTTETPDITVEPANPFVAENETWAWIEVEGTVCGNGTPNGVGVNLTNRSDKVLLVFQGGGICWDWNTCFVVKSAAHIEDTLTPAMVAQDLVALRSPFFDRNDPTNPFRDASFVFFPYCTGDFFAGDSITSYAFLAERRNVHHRGAHNWQHYLPRLRDTFPNPSTVWVTGFSAGGLGVTFNWWRFLDLWPNADVHAMNDCGSTLEPVAGRFNEWKQAVNFQFPPGCDACDEGLPNFFPHYAETVDPRNRLAFLGYRNDFVLQLFMGVGPAVVATRTDALRTAMGSIAHQKTYFITSTDHVMNPNLKTIRTSQASGRVLAWDWVQAWANGSTPWNHAGP
jgi:hypothetical protein